jgi:hypothetical protein
MVENLLISYIQKPSCIILVTVACESAFYIVSATPANIYSTILIIADFENQGAHNLAKKYDPEGKRTIGMFRRNSKFLKIIHSSN